VSQVLSQDSSADRAAGGACDTTASPNRARLDFAFSICLALVGLALAVYAVRISRPLIEAGRATQLTAPGCLLLAASIAIAVLSLLQARISWQRVSSAVESSPVDFTQLRRAAVALVLLGIYMWGCWDRIPGTDRYVPFWLATFLFLMAMMVTLGRPSVRGAAIYLAFSVLIDAAFRHGVGVPLP